MSAPVVALAGNPNTGKTVLFNALTGLRQATGNYAGVTVERSVGAGRLNGGAVRFVDLPGAYSLAARDPSEEVTAAALMGRLPGETPPAAVLAVADASNLERSLYLITQLLELGTPIVVAVNMMDIAARRGLKLDPGALSAALGCPVIPICARRLDGMDALRDALTDALAAAPDAAIRTRPTPVAYPPSLTDAVHTLQAELRAAGDLGEFATALRLLVDEDGVLEAALAPRLGSGGREVLNALRREALTEGRELLAAMEAESRYAWIRERLEEAAPVQDKWTAWLDAILVHPVGGPVIFALVMLLVFQSIYAWPAPFMEFIEDGFALAGERVSALLPGEVTASLVADGVIGGVGSLLVFLPQILVLALFIALLEDCGYMARAAFIMDRLFKWCGLSGKSFIPMLSGFACAIPAIMATRTIESPRERLATILIVPLTSCAARLPVYTLLIGAFVPARPIAGGVLGLQGLVLLALYALGVLIALPAAWLLTRFVLKGADAPFLLELPGYKTPHARTVTHRVYMQGKDFVVNAGGFILAMSVLVWALAYFPRCEPAVSEAPPAGSSVFAAEAAGAVERGPVPGFAFEEGADAFYFAHGPVVEPEAPEARGQLANSYLGRMGRALEPAFTPLGWDWRVGTAVLAAFPAREVVAAAMGAIFHMEADDAGAGPGLRARLQEASWPDGEPLFTLPMVFGLLVFTALCCQCGPTLAVMRRATGAWRWPILAFAVMTLLAYTAAFLTYQGTSWLFSLGGGL